MSLPGERPGSRRFHPGSVRASLVFHVEGTESYSVQREPGGAVGALFLL